MWRCEKCHRDNSDNYDFCPSCGKRRREQTKKSGSMALTLAIVMSIVLALACLFAWMFLGKSDETYVLYEENNVRVLFEHFEKRTYLGGGDIDFLLFSVENDSDDTVNVEIFDVCYDDIMVDGNDGLDVEPVAPGSKSEKPFSLTIDPSYTMLAHSSLPERVSFRIRLLDRSGNMLSESDTIVLDPGFEGSRSPTVFPLSEKLIESDKLDLEIIGYKYYSNQMILYYRYDNFTEDDLYIDGDMYINGVSSNYALYIPSFEARASSRYASVNWIMDVDGINSIGLEGRISDEYLGKAMYSFNAEIELSIDGANAEQEPKTAGGQQGTAKADNKPLQDNASGTERTVLFDEMGVFAETAGISLHDDYVEVRFNVKNNSGKTITVDCSSILVNGQGINPNTNICKLKNGASTVASIDIALVYLQYIGTDSMDTLELSFNIKDEQGDSLFISPPVLLDVSGVNGVKELIKIFHAPVIDKEDLHYEFFGCEQFTDKLICLYTHKINRTPYRYTAVSSECYVNGERCTLFDTINVGVDELGATFLMLDAPLTGNVEQIVLNFDMGGAARAEGYTLSFDASGALVDISGDVTIK